MLTIFVIIYHVLIKPKTVLDIGMQQCTYYGPHGASSTMRRYNLNKSVCVCVCVYVCVQMNVFTYVSVRGNFI